MPYQIINELKKKNIYKDFYFALRKVNKNYDFIRHELYYSIHYKKKGFNFVNTIIAFLRDCYIGIGKQTLNNSDIKKIFFFTINGLSGLKTLIHHHKFDTKQLIKIDLKRNKKISTCKLKASLDISFFKFFIKVFKSIHWKKNDSLLIFIYCLRLSFWASVWNSFILKSKNSNQEIFIHNDFDIYNSSLIYILNKKLINKDIKIFCIQHGIPTDEFFPTKSVDYLVWSKMMEELFIKGNKEYENDSTLYTIDNSSNRFNKNFLDERKTYLNVEKSIYFISQGHTKIYGEKVNKDLINFCVESSSLLSNFYCLLHPTETIKNNNYPITLNDKIIQGPHNFNREKENIKIYVSFCSTAIIDIMLNNHLVIGIDIHPTTSLLAFKYFKPQLSVKNPKELDLLVKKITNDREYLIDLLIKQKKHLTELIGQQ